MSILQTNNPIIIYNKKTKQEAVKIGELMEKNPLIFRMILSEYKGISFSDKEGYLNLQRDGNIEKTLTTEIISALEREYQKDATSHNDEDIELGILKYALIERTDSFDLYSIEKLPENMIYYYMAYLRYKEDHDQEKLFSFVLSPQNEEKEALFNEIHQKQGITLYNLLLQEQLLLLLGKFPGVKPLDIFLVNNIREMTTLIQDVFTRKLIEGLSEKTPPEELDRVTFKQYDRLCKEYLIRIDPSLKWLKIYLAAQANGNIKYLKAGEGKWESLNRDGTNIITAPLTGTIEDVVSTIHEFPHYIVLENLQEDENVPRTLAEFPSLFFEENIYSFLLEKGYSEKQIITLKNQRERWTEKNSLAVLPYLNYLKEFIIEGPLTEELIQQYLNRVQLSIESSYDTMEKQGANILESADSLLDSDLKALVASECLIRNTFLIKKNDVLLEYPYVIGNYLAEVANKQSETDQYVIPDVLNYTENLGRISPRIIFDRFGISLPKAEADKDKQYQKTN